MAEILERDKDGHLPGWEGICPANGLGCYRPCAYKRMTGKECPLGKDCDKGLVFKE